MAYPFDMQFEAVLSNHDPQWTVEMFEQEREEMKAPVLKPGDSRTEVFNLHFDRPFEIRRLTFIARAHGRQVADQVLQIRPADERRIGVNFMRDGDGHPRISWQSLDSPNR